MGARVKQASKLKVFTCPRCAFIVKSPYGEIDIAEHARLHVDLHHPELAYISKGIIGSMVKEEK